MAALDINDCINEICPWSGKPVQADSLIKYDGKVVGFCNPGCRDKFEAAIRHFGGASLPNGREARDGSNHVAVYRKRMFRSHGNSDVDGIKLKIYTITANGRDETDLIQVLDRAGVALGNSLIPQMPHQRLGYLIHHAGEDADWLLTRVWLRGDIVSGLLAANHGNGFEDVSDPLVECVWESVVGQHERNAWVRHMMSVPSNAEGYLSDYLAAGWH